MAVNDVFRVALVGGLNEQEIVNTFHYQQTTANTSGLSEVESLARAFNLSVVPSVLAAISVDVSYGAIESRSFIPPGGPMVGFDLALTATGGIDDPAAPPTVAVIIRRKTAFLGRKYRGRAYFAGVNTAAIAGGKVLDAAIGPWEDLRDAMLAAISWTAGGSPNFRPVIAALDGSVIVAPVGVRWTPVNSCFLDKTLRSQRRREIGVGA